MMLLCWRRAPLLSQGDVEDRVQGQKNFQVESRNQHNKWLLNMESHSGVTGWGNLGKSIHVLVM